MRRRRPKPIVLVILLLSLAAAGYAAWRAAPRLGPRTVGNLIQHGSRQVTGPAILMSAGGDGALPDLLVPNRSLEEAPAAVDGDAQPVARFFLSYLPAGQSSVAWEVGLSAAGEQLGRGHVTADVSRFYAMDGRELRAFARADGTPLWRVTLSDGLHFGCDSCLARAADLLVVLTADRLVHGVDAGSGAVRWQRRLNAAHFPLQAGLFPLGERIGLLDRIAADGSGAVVMRLLDAGGEVTAEVGPACPDAAGARPAAALNTGDGLLVDTAAARAVFLLQGSGQGCAQAWDLRTAAPLWQVFLPPGVILDTPDRDQAAYLGQSDALVRVQQGVGSGLIAIDRTDGTVRPLLAATDYWLSPLAQWQQTLVVRATRQQGNPQDELWAVDVATGQRRWTMALQATREMALDRAVGSGTWSYRALPAGLAVLQQTAASPTIQYTLQAWDTGQVVRQGGVTPDSGFWSGAAWTNDFVFLSVRALYTLDLATGSGRAVWP